MTTKTKVPRTSAEHKIRQSINAKTERSEQDVIKSVEKSEKDVIDSLNFTLGALFIIQFATFIVALIGLGY